MLEVGRVCVKTAGREAGSKCVIVEVVDNSFVIVDGNVRRKRCSISHLEPLIDTIELEKGASHEEVVEAFKKLGMLSESPKVRRKEKTEKATGLKKKSTSIKKGPKKEKREEP